MYKITNKQQDGLFQLTYEEFLKFVPVLLMAHKHKCIMHPLHKGWMLLWPIFSRIGNDFNLANNDPVIVYGLTLNFSWDIPQDEIHY